MIQNIHKQSNAPHPILICITYFIIQTSRNWINNEVQIIITNLAIRLLLFLSKGVAIITAIACSRASYLQK